MTPSGGKKYALQGAGMGGSLAPTPDLAATVAKPAGVDHPKRPFVSPYRITSSARSRSDCGIVNPSAVAVFRLNTSSKLVGCSAGVSAGDAPLSILSVKRAAMT